VPEVFTLLNSGDDVPKKAVTEQRDEIVFLISLQ
jgi:hypothetical protein